MAKKMRTFLSLEDRKIIEKMVKEGFFFKDIAIALERTSSCIGREIQKNGSRWSYNALDAHENFKEGRRAFAENHSILSESLKDAIKKGFNDGMTPAQLAKSLGLRRSTIYAYLNRAGFLNKNEPGNILERIEILEEQIKIILEFITKEQK